MERIVVVEGIERVKAFVYPHSTANIFSAFLEHGFDGLNRSSRIRKVVESVFSELHSVN